MPPPEGTIDLFLSYCHKDLSFRQELETHLALLRRSGLVRAWHDGEIVPGQEWQPAIFERLEAARVIVLLLSPDFLASDFCHKEMSKALERHARGEAQVVPVLLRACGWKYTPLADLQALPRGARPIKGWEDRDEAFDDVVEGIRRAIQELSAPNPPPQDLISPPKLQPVAPPAAPAIARAPAARPAGTLWVDKLGQRMRWVPPDTYWIGRSTGEEKGPNDETRHQVRLTEGYWLGETPVTQALWSKLVPTNPSRFKGAERPVEKVSWWEAVAFCNVASEYADLEPYYELIGAQGQLGTAGFECAEVRCNEGANGYRLPTEACWEIAARAGAPVYTPDLAAVAWYAENSGGESQPVGKKAGNAWNFHDMLGNVWEWVWDCYAPYPNGLVVDPTGPEEGTERVIRGGSWYDHARFVRAAYRNWYGPGYRSDSLGFRFGAQDQAWSRQAEPSR